MNSHPLLTKYSNLVKQYMCQIYYDNDDSFINTEQEEEEWETFTEEAFNSDGFSFYKFVIEEDMDFSSKEILFLLNWSNKYFEDTFGPECMLTTDITETKIANAFGYAYIRSEYEEMLTYLKENIDSDSDSNSDSDSDISTLTEEINLNMNPETNPEQ